MAVSVRTLTYVLPLLHQPPRSPPPFSASRLRRGPTAASSSFSIFFFFSPRDSTSNLVAETFSLFRPPNHPLCHSPRSSFLSSLPFAIFAEAKFPHHRSASNSLSLSLFFHSRWLVLFFAGIWEGCLMRSGYRWFILSPLLMEDRFQG